METTILSYLMVICFGCAGSIPLSPTSNGEGCQFGDEVYQLGESWHPVLEPTGLEPCVTCQCNGPNRVSCDRKTCPDLNCASYIHVQNRCCPVCRKKNSTMLSPPSEISPTVTKDYCRLRGLEYYDGQSFPGTWLITGKKNNDCVQCTCSAGLIYCDHTCPEAECSNPMVLDGSCCPVCTQDEDEPSMSKTNAISIPAVSMIEDDSLLNNFPPLLDSRYEDIESRYRGHVDYACIANGETYYHGDRWQPILDPFGIASCVICICKFGETECSRVECPAIEDMSCKNPVTVRGKCCQVCEDEEIIQGPPVINGSQLPLCLNEFETHLVYRYEPKVAYRDGLAIITYAVEDITLNTVRISQWEISLGTIQKYLVEEIPSINFERAKVTREHITGRFRLIGATTKRRFDKLLRREARLERRCNEGCLGNILKLSKVLRVSVVERSLNCSQSERTLNKRRRSI